MDCSNVCIIKESDLSQDLADKILLFQSLAFPNEKWFKSQRWYHTKLSNSDIWILISTLAKTDIRFKINNTHQISALVRLISRNIILSNSNNLISNSKYNYSVDIFGIGNVCTSYFLSNNTHGSGGFGRALMTAVNSFINNNNAYRIGFLFTDNEHYKFYQKFNWKIIRNEIIDKNDKCSKCGIKMIYLPDSSITNNNNSITNNSDETFYLSFPNDNSNFTKNLALIPYNNSIDDSNMWKIDLNGPVW